MMELPEKPEQIKNNEKKEAELKIRPSGKSFHIYNRKQGLPYQTPKSWNLTHKTRAEFTTRQTRLNT